MKFANFSFALGVSLLMGAFCAPPPAQADDIDIYVGSSSGGNAPNILFILDNTSNWSDTARQWPDAPTQGQGELFGITNSLAALNKLNETANVGIEMLTDYGTPYGGYLRFGVRNTGNATDYTALTNILGTSSGPSYSIYANINTPTEKIGTAHRDTEAALYEAYKYFNALPAYAGANSNGNSFADYPGATGLQTAAGQGASTPDALQANGKTYNGPSNTQCAKNYVILIANNMDRGSATLSSLSYEGVSAGPAIPPDANAISGYYTREWVRFLEQHNISTFILDAYTTKKHNVQYSNVLIDAAGQSGANHYYPVTSAAAVSNALADILINIQSENSAFAAANVPVSATNRNVDQNKVFVGLFRPDQNAAPRWYGNLRRYQVVFDSSGAPATGDAAGVVAVNDVTGSFADCSVSFFTSDTSAYVPTVPSGGTALAPVPYWSIVPEQSPNIPSSACPMPNSPLNPASNPVFGPPSGVTWSPFSDLPDGPAVEKGGVAEVLRRGNVAIGTTPTWLVNRNILTQSGTSALIPFNTSTPGLTAASFGVPSTATTPPTMQQMVNWISGWDGQDVNKNGYTDPSSSTGAKETRPMIHGDVIHSTPQPITYSGNPDGVVVYYGSNDGMFHAVYADSGTEVWSFLAPEFYSRMYRLYANSPLIAYPNLPSGITPAPLKKDYFFDGTAGNYQSSDGSTVWIYPTMRRGGRMVYAFDVSPVSGSPPTSPTFLWKAGCPDLGDDTGCTSTAMSAIGQTWSTPKSALLKDGSTALAPAIIFGGGYDSTQTVNSAGVVTATSCEDQNSATPTCTGRKGSVVFVLDGKAGTVLKTFTLPGTNGTPGSVAGDVALLDVNGDGYTDYAYLADTNGFVYRIDFVDGPTTLNPLPMSSWRITQIAGVSNTAGYGRKFLFAPTLALNQNKVYVGLGTGDREHPLISEYPYTTPVTNHFYVFVDDPASTTTYLNLDGNTMANATNANCTTPAPVLPQNTANPSSTSPVGWYLPLTHYGIGEQTVTPALVLAGRITFGTNRPLAATSACTNQLGDAQGYLLSVLNGAGAIGVNGAVCGGDISSKYAGGGLPPPPQAGIIPVTGSDGKPVYTGVCFGCPNASGGTSTTYGGGAAGTSMGETRKHVYWFTPDYQ